MPPSDQYIRSEHTSASPVGERLVLYHRLTKTAVVLNPTGGWMWQQLSKPRTSADLVAELRAKFPALPIDQAERDVSAFLTDLTRHSMVLLG